MRIIPEKEAFAAAKIMQEMHRALKLVMALHDHPEAVPRGYKVKLDPKAEEQVLNAIRGYEYVLLPEVKEAVPEAFENEQE